MYIITELTTGKWYCELMIQDGWERWEKNTREEALRSMIRGARALNNSYIHEGDIVFQKQAPKPTIRMSEGTLLSAEDEKLLKQIKSGHLKVLPFDHYLLKYRITEKEAEMVIKVREGDAYWNYYE